MTQKYAALTRHHRRIAEERRFTQRNRSAIARQLPFTAAEICEQRIWF